MDGMDVLAPYDRSLSHKTKDTLVSSKTLKKILSKRPLQKNPFLLDDKPHIYIIYKGWCFETCTLWERELTLPKQEGSPVTKTTKSDGQKVPA